MYLPSVTTVLGSTESEKSKAGLRQWQQKNPGALQAAATRGTAIHKCCEDYIRGIPVDCPDEYKSFWNEKHIARAKKLKMTQHEIVTLASIIEGEAIYDSERPIISAVYHNRLNIGMKLQADPTVQYIIKDGPRRLLNKDLKINSPYNTYLNKGLPPGPINSPGRKSLHAALYPHDNEYLYFVAKGDGYHTFSKNEKDHEKAKKNFQKVRRKVQRKKAGL